MRRLLFGAIATTLALTACANSTGSETDQRDQAPVELNVEEAGAQYLSIVCQSNAANDDLYDAFDAGAVEFAAGGEPSVVDINVAAEEHVRLSEQKVELFADPYFIWPANVREQIQYMHERSKLFVASDRGMLDAQTYKNAYEAYITNPGLSPEQQAAPEEIRESLMIGSDEDSECVGYETAQDQLYKDMAERNK